ncbi:MAG: beta strand repeat-containing protein, partial [Ilumatobacteraceae bacterium]
METDVAGTADTGSIVATSGPSTKVGLDQFTIVLTDTSSLGNTFLDAVAGGSVSGTVWNDVDGSGTFSLGEVGKAGATVTIAKTGFSATATSAADGTYSFTGLTYGAYTVTVALTGWTVKGTSSHSFTLAATGTETGRDFYLQQSNLVISGTVYQDNNADGIIQTNTTLAGATVRAYRAANADGIADGAAVATSGPTPGNGQFSLTGLTPGTYLVVETDPSASYLSINAIPGVGSVTKVSNDALSVVLLDANSTGNQFLDAPKLAQITGVVYSDTNGNGAVDAASDGKLSGITVYIDANANDVLDAGETSTTSAVTTGAFSFTGLLAGTYVVRSVAVTNFERLLEPITVTLASGASGTTGTANLLHRQTNLQISGFVYDDQNADSAAGGAEPGLSGVTVTLYADTNANGSYTAGTDVLQAATTTAADSSVSFASLWPGRYVLVETDPTNFLSTTALAGTTGSSLVTGQPSQLLVVLTTADVTNNRFLDSWSYSISGTVYNDAGATVGSYDAGDVAKGGVTVSISGTASASTTSSTAVGSVGTFSFTGLKAGTYSLTYTVPTNWANTGTRPQSITLSATTSVTGRELLARPTSLQINGAVYRNDPADGTTNSANLAGAKVDLYRDTNGNGVWDGALTDLSAAAQQTTSTSSGAKATYSFTGLSSGTYFVVETNPTAIPYVSTNAVPGSAIGTKVSNDVMKFVLVETNSNSNFFFDAPQNRTLTGTVYRDLNGNGTFEAGTDTARSGVTVTVTRTGTGTYDGVTTTFTLVTNASGVYSQSGLLGGNYSISTAVEAGFSQATATLAALSGVTGTTTQNLFTRINTLSVSGSTWEDKDGSGSVNAGDVVIPVEPTVYLWRDNGNNVFSATTDTLVGTDTTGSSFAFTDVSSGTYFLNEANPLNYASTGAQAGTGGTSTVVTFDSLRVLLTDQNYVGGAFLDAYADAQISGTLFRDRNGNGTQDAGEGPVIGMNVYVDDNTNGAYDVSESFGTTDDAGAWLIPSLLPGPHKPRVDVPAGWVGTGTLVRTVSAISATTVDGGSFSVRRNDLSIAGTVYDDANANGVVDPDRDLDGDGIVDIPAETGLAGVSVTIYRDTNGNGTWDGSSTDLSAGATTTDATGAFSFTPVFSGTYFVVESDPAAYTSVLATAGSVAVVTSPYVTSPSAGSSAVETSGRVKVSLTDGAASGIAFLDATKYTIAGTFYLDVNGDGSVVGDSGYQGATVFLDTDGDGVLDAGETSAATLADGTFSFTDLTGGSWTVDYVLPASWTNTSAVRPASRTIAQGASLASVGAVTFSAQPGGLSIAGTVWHDVTHDASR